MLRIIVLIAVAISLSSPVAMAGAAQAKPAQRPATKKARHRRARKTGAPGGRTSAEAGAATAARREDDYGVHAGRAGLAEHHLSPGRPAARRVPRRDHARSMRSQAIGDAEHRGEALSRAAVSRNQARRGGRSANRLTRMAAQLAQMQAMGLGQRPGQKPRGGVVTHDDHADRHARASDDVRARSAADQDDRDQAVEPERLRQVAAEG